MRCPRCRYPLHGLDVYASCPECGTTEYQRKEALRIRPFAARIALMTNLAAYMFSVLGCCISLDDLEVVVFAFVAMVNAIPFVIAWCCWTLTRRRVEPLDTVIIAVPAAVLPLVALVALYYLTFRAQSPGARDPLDGIVIVMSPIFSVPAAILGWIIGFGASRLMNAR